jgi:hypothetical protein
MGCVWRSKAASLKSAKKQNALVNVLVSDEIDLLNKYGCRPFPRPDAFTFASSTGTSVSLHMIKQIK